jgi:hypothetical protein
MNRLKNIASVEVFISMEICMLFLCIHGGTCVVAVFQNVPFRKLACLVLKRCQYSSVILWVRCM